MWWGEKKTNPTSISYFPTCLPRNCPFSFPCLCFCFRSMTLSLCDMFSISACPSMTWSCHIYIYESTHNQGFPPNIITHPNSTHPPKEKGGPYGIFFIIACQTSVLGQRTVQKIISAKRTKRSEPIPRSPSPTSQSFTHKTFIYAHAICYRQDQSVDSTCGGNGGGGGRGCLNLRTSFAKKSTKRSH